MIITVAASIRTDVATAWQFYNDPKHIVNWNFAAPDWCCPSGEVDLKVGGKFTSRMEARDGSIGFDFWGHYTTVKPNE